MPCRRSLNKVCSCFLRSRSRSPASEARSRLPAELLQHLEFGLVEPTQEGMRGEIPYTSVETTAATASAGARHPRTASRSGDRRERRSEAGSVVSHARRM